MIQKCHLLCNFQCRQCFNALFTSGLCIYDNIRCVKIEENILFLLISFLLLNKITLIHNFFVFSELTVGGAKSNSKFFLPQSISSRVNNLSSCEAARCSLGKRLGLQVISSRNSIVCVRSFSSCSKS